MAFVAKDQALPVKVEVVSAKPEELPPKQETTDIVLVRAVTTTRRRRGILDWLLNW
jgi:16S rRNA G527 N7-methylase RsmG